MRPTSNYIVRKPLTVIIVTLSVVCTLKGTCQYTLFDVRGVEIHEYKRSKQCQRCQRYSTDFNALNAMYVEDVEDGVCIQSKYCYLSHSCRRVSKMSNTIVLCIQWPLTPARREGYLFEPSALWV